MWWNLFFAVANFVFSYLNGMAGNAGWAFFSAICGAVSFGAFCVYLGERGAR